MIRKRLVGLTIIALLALVWSLGAALVVYGLITSSARTDKLGALALDRVMSAERTQLDVLFRGYERDLQQEVAFIGAHDSLPDADLIAHWKPLLESDWSLLAIGMADEHGDERRLAREEAIWSFTSAIGGSVNGPPIITEWPFNDAAMSKVRRHIGDPKSDPRNAAWFGQTMEDRETMPIWTADSAQGKQQLNVSVLLRGRPGSSAPYRILFFTLSPVHVLRSTGSRSAMYSPLYLRPDGRPFEAFDTTAYGRLASAIWRNWNTEKTKQVFTVAYSGTTYMAQVIPYSLNGTMIHCGALIGTDALRLWTRAERQALWLAVAVLGSFATLFVWAFIRTRRTDRRVIVQEKRSRTQERKLAKALGEREILDREVHHRVKNNLQVVSSLLNLQAQRIADPEVRNEFTRSKRRIDSMALVHHKLYSQQDLRAIDLQLFLLQIADSVSAMFEPQSRTVSHSVDADMIRADADTAIQLGLILCELLANCYQHAFPYATGGHIDISLRAAEDGQFRMTVKDNGRGIERDPQNRTTELGLEIVEALADQIDGSASASADEGTRVDIMFRIQHPAEPRV